jgi:hypothetical protein
MECSLSTVHFVFVLCGWHSKLNRKSIPVTCRGGPYSCETLKIPRFLDNRLTDDGEIVSLTRLGRSLLLTKIPGTHFCLRLSRPRGHSAAGMIRYIGKSIDLIGIQARDFPACSIVPQRTTLPHLLWLVAPDTTRTVFQSLPNVVSSRVSTTRCSGKTHIPSADFAIATSHRQ